MHSLSSPENKRRVRKPREYGRKETSKWGQRLADNHRWIQDCFYQWSFIGTQPLSWLRLPYTMLKARLSSSSRLVHTQSLCKISLLNLVKIHGSQKDEHLMKEDSGLPMIKSSPGRILWERGFKSVWFIQVLIGPSLISALAFSGLGPVLMFFSLLFLWPILLALASLPNSIIISQLTIPEPTHGGVEKLPHEDNFTTVSISIQRSSVLLAHASSSYLSAKNEKCFLQLGGARFITIRHLHGWVTDKTRQQNNTACTPASQLLKMRFFSWLMLAERLVKMHFPLISSEGVNLVKFYGLQTTCQMNICFL